VGGRDRPLDTKILESQFTERLTRVLGRHLDSLGSMWPYPSAFVLREIPGLVSRLIAWNTAHAAGFWFCASC